MSDTALPPVWVAVKDGRIIGTHDEPFTFNEIEGVRYDPSGWPQDCGLSWDGNRISGNRASIDAVQKILHAAHTVELMRDRIKDLESRLGRG
jgi:hypothetical protein